jgi:hypothetical protein
VNPYDHTEENILNQNIKNSGNYSALLNFSLKRLCTLSEVEVFLTNTSFFAQRIANSVLGKQEHGLRAVIQELTE